MGKSLRKQAFFLAVLTFFSNFYRLKLGYYFILFGVRCMGRYVRSLVLLVFAAFVFALPAAAFNSNTIVSTEPTAGEDLVVENGPKLRLLMEQAVGREVDGIFDFGPYVRGLESVSTDVNVWSYRVTVANYGTKAATNVSLLCRMPYVTSLDSDNVEGYHESPFLLSFTDGGGIGPVDGTTFSAMVDSLSPGESKTYEFTARTNPNFSWDATVFTRSFAEVHCNESSGVGISNELPLEIVGTQYPDKVSNDVILTAMQALDSDSVPVYKGYDIDYDDDNTRILYKVKVENTSNQAFTFRTIFAEIKGSNQFYAKDNYVNLVGDNNLATFRFDENVTLEPGKSTTVDFWLPVSPLCPDDVTVKFQSFGTMYDDTDVVLPSAALAAHYDKSMHVTGTVAGKPITSETALHKNDIIRLNGYFIGPNTENTETAVNFNKISSNLEVIDSENSIRVEPVGNKGKYVFEAVFRVKSNTERMADITLDYTVKDGSYNYSRSSDTLVYPVCEKEPKVWICQHVVKDNETGHVCDGYNPVDEDLSKLEGVRAGDTVEYSIHVDSYDSHMNHAFRAVIMAVPSDMAIVPGSVTNNGVANNESNNVVWSFNSLSKGEHRYSFKVKVPEDVSKLTTYYPVGALCMISAGNMLDTDLYKGHKTATVVKPMASDISVSLSQNIGTDISGEDVDCVPSDIVENGIEYKITVMNKGPGVAKNVRVTLDGPDGFSLGRIDTIGSLASGRSKIITVKAANTSVVPGQYTAKASCAWDFCDAEVSSKSVKVNVVDSGDIVSHAMSQSVNGGDYTSDTVNVSAGDEISYKYRITNNSRMTIKNVDFQLSSVSGVRFVSSDMTGAVVQDDSVSYRVVDLAAGTTAELVVKGVVLNGNTQVHCESMVWDDDPGDATHIVFDDLNGTFSEKPIVTPTPEPTSEPDSLTVSLVQSVNSGAYTSDVVEAEPYDTISYRFTIKNISDEDITDVNFRDVLPYGLLDTVDNELVVITEKTARWSVIRAHETVTHVFTLTVPPIAHDTEWLNKATISYNGREVTSNEVKAVSTYVVPGPADVRVKVEQSKQSDSGFTYDIMNVDAGDMIYYRITAYNVGYMDANNVVVTDVLPSGLLMQDSSDGQWKPGGTWTGRTSVLTKSKDVQWVIQAKVPDVASTTRFVNKATVVYDGGENVSNEVQANCFVIPQPGNPNVHVSAAQCMKNGEPARDMLTVEPGDVITYEYRVWNDGEDAAQNVTLNANIQNSFIYDGQTRWTFDSIPAGGEETVRFDVTVPEVSSSQEWVNFAQVCWLGHSEWLDSNALRIKIVHENPGPGPSGPDMSVDSWQALGLTQPDDGWTKSVLEITPDMSEDMNLYQKYVIVNESEDYSLEGLTLRTKYPSAYGLVNSTMYHDFEEPIEPGMTMTVVFEVPVRNLINRAGEYSTESVLLADGEVVYRFSELSVKSVAEQVIETPEPTPEIPVTPTPVSTPTPEVGEADLSYTFSHSLDGVNFVSTDLNVRDSSEVMLRAQVTNRGTATARLVQADINLASGLTVVGNGYSSEFWLEIKPGETKTMDLRVRVPVSTFDRTYTSKFIVGYDGRNIEAGNLRLIQKVVTPTPTPDVPTPTPDVTPSLPVMNVEIWQQVNNLEFTKDEVSVEAGDKLTYKLVLSNTGTTFAQDVNLKDVLPAGLVSDDNTVFWWSDILAGETRTLYINTTVPSVLSTTVYENKAHLDWSLNKNGIDSNIVKAIQTVKDDTGVVAGDLKVWQFVSVGTSRPAADSDLWLSHDVDVSDVNNKTAYFKYVIQNTSNKKVTGVTLDTALPSGFEGNGHFGPYDLEPGQTVTVYMNMPLSNLSNGSYGLSGDLRVDDVSLWSGDSYKIHVLMSVTTPDVLPKLDVRPYVVVSSNGKPETGWSEQDVISIVGTDAAGYYRYVIRNTGGVKAENVVLTSVLPAGFEFTDGDGVFGPYDIPAGGQVTVDMSIDLKSLGAGEYNVESVLTHDGKTVWSGSGLGIRLEEKPVVTETPGQTEVPGVTEKPDVTPPVVSDKLKVSQYLAVSNDGQPAYSSSVWSTGHVKIDETNGYTAYYQYVFENMSDEELKDLVLTTKLPEGFTGNETHGPYTIPAHGTFRFVLSLPLDSLTSGVYGVSGNVTLDGDSVWSGVSPVLKVESAVKPTPDSKGLSIKATQSVNGGGHEEGILNVKPGDIITYKFVVTNDGNEVIENVVLTVQIPDGVVLVKQRGTDISWTWDEIRPGESKEVSFDVQIPESSVGLKLNILGQLSGDGIDSIIESNELETELEGEGQPIEVIMTQNVNCPYTTNTLNVSGGETVFYRILVRNVSDETIDDIELNSILPEGFAVSRDLTWDIGSLEPGAEKIIDFTATVGMTQGLYSTKSVVSWLDNTVESNVVSLDLRLPLPGETEEPGHTEEPGETETPDVTEKPDASEKPGDTEEPDKTEEPGESEKPDVTEAPDVSEKPGETEEPGESQKPEETQKPDETIRPDETERPNETQGPDETLVPNKTESPKPGPYETVGPDVSKRPIVLPDATGGGNTLGSNSGGSNSGSNTNGSSNSNSNLANPNKNNPNTGVESSSVMYIMILVGLVAVGGVSWFLYKRKK